MIPRLTVMKNIDGQLKIVDDHLPINAVERAIVDALNSLFNNPSLSGYSKKDDYYFITVHSNLRITKENLNKLEEDSGCEVAISDGLYGFLFFFTPKREEKTQVRDELCK